MPTQSSWMTPGTLMKINSTQYWNLQTGMSRFFSLPRMKTSFQATKRQLFWNCNGHGFGPNDRFKADENQSSR